MRVFIDACIDPRVAQILVGHDVKTAFALGWQRLPDHILLPKASADFDVFVTADQGFEYEHNLSKLPIGIVMVHVARNKLEYYKPVESQLLAAVVSVRPGQVLHVRAKASSNPGAEVESSPHD